MVFNSLPNHKFLDWSKLKVLHIAHVKQLLFNAHAHIFPPLKTRTRSRQTRLLKLERHTRIVFILFTKKTHLWTSKNLTNETWCQKWDSNPRPHTWNKFKKHCRLMFDGPLKGKSTKEQCAYILSWVGERGRTIHEFSLFPKMFSTFPKTNFKV